MIYNFFFLLLDIEHYLFLNCTKYIFKKREKVEKKMLKMDKKNATKIAKLIRLSFSESTNSIHKKKIIHIIIIIKIMIVIMEMYLKQTKKKHGEKLKEKLKKKSMLIFSLNGIFSHFFFLFFTFTTF